MTSRKTSRRLVVMLVCSALALVLASAAEAHSSISLPVAKAKTLQQFTLEVQAEKENARTTRVDVAFPDGFNVETFPATPGWKREAQRVQAGLRRRGTRPKRRLDRQRKVCARGSRLPLHRHARIRQDVRRESATALLRRIDCRLGRSRRLRATRRDSRRRLFLWRRRWLDPRGLRAGACEPRTYHRPRLAGRSGRKSTTRMRPGCSDLTM